MRVELRNIKKSFLDRTVLDIHGLEFESGRIYAVLGPNGSGKTTLLRILSGLEKADGGTLKYNGGVELPEGSMALLLQNPYLFDRTVLENVKLAVETLGNAEELCTEALKHVGMDGFLHAKARTLSGGEAQRVAVARTLMLERQLLLLDEPASWVDISSMRLIEEYIKRVNSVKGSTIVFTTHNPSQALRIADEVVILYEGCVVEKGLPGKVLKTPKASETREFLKNWGI